MIHAASMNALMLIMACVVLISQKVLESAAQVIPWLPKDNEWTLTK